MIKENIIDLALSIIDEAKSLNYLPEVYGSVYNDPLSNVVDIHLKYLKEFDSIECEINFKGISRTLKSIEFNFYKKVYSKISKCSYTLKLGRLNNLIIYNRFLEYNVNDFEIICYDNKIICTLVPNIIDASNDKMESINMRYVTDSISDNHGHIIDNFQRYVNDYLNEKYLIINGVYVDKTIYESLEKDHYKWMKRNNIPLTDENIQKIKDKVKAFVAGCSGNFRHKQTTKMNKIF